MKIQLRNIYMLGALVLSAAAFADKDQKGVLDIGYGRPPTNAFCVVTPHSTPQLLNQVKSNPAVMDRYRRHFAMNDKEILGYFSDLRPGRLVRDSVYSVYGVPKNGVFHFKRRLMKAGTNVFMDRDGHAILQMVCGNPLTLGPNNPVSLSEGPTPADSASGARAGGAEGFDGMMAMTDLDTTSTTAPSTPAAMQIAPAIIGKAAQPFAIGSILPWFVGGAVLVGRGSNSNTPAPEPASMAVLAVGFGAIAARRKKQS